MYGSPTQALLRSQAQEALSQAHWRQPGGMISASALDSHRRFTILGGGLFMARLRHFGQATPVLRYFNWIAAALVTLSATYLHALFMLNAGGLWRDEAAFVHLSLLPSVSQVWQNLPYDHCPILTPLAVRAVRSDVGWYVNLFARRNAGRAAIG